MPKVNCAVIGCSNSTYKLNKWKAESCEKHGVKKKDCDCAAPFKLFCFPSILRNSKQRSKWVELLRRETTAKGKWEPGSSDRVCSIHFVDEQPSANNPYPTVNMGYEKKNQAKPRRIIKKFPQEKQVDVASSSDVDMLPSDAATVSVDDAILDSRCFISHLCRAFLCCYLFHHIM